MKGSKEVLRGIKRQGMYTLKVEVVSGLVDMVSTKHVSKAELWNKRLGHVSERGLVKFLKQNRLCGDKVKKMSFMNLVYLVNRVR